MLSPWSVGWLGGSKLCRHGRAEGGGADADPAAGLAVGTHEVPRARPTVERGADSGLDGVGSHGLAAYRYGELLDLITTGKLDPASLITRTVSLEEAPADVLFAEVAPGADMDGATLARRAAALVPGLGVAFSASRWA